MALGLRRILVVEGLDLGHVVVLDRSGRDSSVGLGWRNGESPAVGAGDFV
jgi:hypothetical protein